jgi:hypothetical protein
MEDIMIDAKNDFNSWYKQTNKQTRLDWTWSMKESLQHKHTLDQLGKRRRVETLRMSALKSVR